MSYFCSSGGAEVAARKTCHPLRMRSTYFELYRMRTDRHWLHQKLAAFARWNGLKAAAREFGCSRNTVRKWLRRHQPGKPSSLQERSRRPHPCPHQTSSGLEAQIVKLRRQTGFGAERLVHEFALPCSHNAIARILRQHRLTRPRKKKPATKQQLRAVKRHWQLFGQFSTDTKYLQDIPHYWPQMTHLKLPRFQYTAREPLSGACFTGYADQLSKSYATFLAEQLSVHLAGHGVNLSTLTWQTDNGSEFLENQDEQGLPATVRALGSDPRYIPPKRYTWQSDVKTVHRLVEDAFFDRETFTGPADFWAKVTTYCHSFNLVRPNRGKEWQCPLQILNASAPALAGALLARKFHHRGDLSFWEAGAEGNGAKEAKTGIFSTRGHTPPNPRCWSACRGQHSIMFNRCPTP
jgi:transposase-like protein